MKGFDFVVTGNYIGDMEDDPSFILGNVQIGGDTANPSFALHHRISDYETLDMQLSYEFLKPEMQPATGLLQGCEGWQGHEQGCGRRGKQHLLAAACSGTPRSRVGVNNAFDRYPPTVLAAFNDNYDTSNYTIRNRYWYISLTKRF